MSQKIKITITQAMIWWENAITIAHWAEVYFALCEAVVLVLVLECDSAAKTDLDIYLGLAMVYDLSWLQTEMSTVFISTIVRAKWCQQRPSHRPWALPLPRAGPPPPSPWSRGCRDMNCEVSSLFRLCSCILNTFERNTFSNNRINVIICVLTHLCFYHILIMDGT